MSLAFFREVSSPQQRFVFLFALTVIIQALHHHLSRTPAGIAKFSQRNS